MNIRETPEFWLERPIDGTRETLASKAERKAACQAYGDLCELRKSFPAFADLEREATLLKFITRCAVPRFTGGYWKGNFEEGHTENE